MKGFAIIKFVALALWGFSLRRDAALKKLLDEAEYKYANGISIVRPIRRKYRYAEISRIEAVDVWEEHMARAGREGVPVFLLGSPVRF